MTAVPACAPDLNQKRASYLALFWSSPTSPTPSVRMVASLSSMATSPKKDASSRPPAAGVDAVHLTFTGPWHRRMEARNPHPQGLAGPPGLRRPHHQRLPRRRPRRLPHPEVARLSRECRIGVDGCEEGSCRPRAPHLRSEMWGTRRRI